ncbi:MAG TPA: YihY/virulence factor BrkB family protein, partial [Thermoanaerobaculia bacterium]|nr:YihY/virulence factor BrkB family protein [Thermoanaerobaculia bacterium]
LKETAKKGMDDDVFSLGAALAYYTVFSLAPLLLIAISVAGLVYGRRAVQGELVGQIQGMIGKQGAEAVQTMLAHNWRTGSGVLPTVVGIITILFGVSGVFGQLQTSLNKIWEVAPKPDRGIKSFLKSRFLSFGMVLGIGFLLLVSLIVSAALSGVSAYAIGLVPGLKVLFTVLSFVVSFAVITLLFAMIFRYLPDARVSWEDVWVGSAATALLFTVGKTLIGLYLGKSSVASAYGAAGSFVVLLLWVYYSSQILFFGAELTQVYAKRYGQEIAPDRHAIRVKQVKVSEEEPGFEKVEKVAKEKEVSRKVEAGSPVSPQVARSARSEVSGRSEREPAAAPPILRNAAVVLFLALALRKLGKRERRSAPA